MVSSSQPAEKSILIVTQAFDPHADELITLLRYMGREPIRVNTDAIPGNSLLSYTFARGTNDLTRRGALAENLAHYTLFIDGRLIEAQKVQSVWWRRPAPYQFAGTLQPEELRLATTETQQAMQSFWLALIAQNCAWMSTPLALTLASNLPEQMRRAHCYGFAIPRALVTTRAAQMRAFYQETAGQMVYCLLSCLSTPILDGCQSSAAQASAALLSPDLLETFEQMVSVPCLFYERLPAQRFLVVIVIADQIFAAQTTQTAPLDQVAHWWSSSVYELPYEPVVLPEVFADHCRAYVHSYGLSFGVLRFAYGPREQLFFVSLDPVGAFLWLEQQCPDLHMSEALAQWLIDGGQAER